MSIRQLRAHIAKELNEGVDSKSIIQEIYAKEYEFANAEQLVNEVLKSQKRKYFKIVGISAGVGLLGLIVSIASLDAEVRVYWYGIVICGLIGVVYGLNKLTKLR